MRTTSLLIMLPSFAGGGAERSVLNIISNHDPKKVKISVLLISFEGEYISQVPQNSVEYLFQTKRFFRLGPIQKVLHFLIHTIPFFKKTIREINPDLILTVTESMNYLGYFFKKVNAIGNAKWIVRSGNNIIAEAKSKPFPLSHMLPALLRETYHLSDHIIVISRGAKEFLISDFDIDKEKIHVIYNPIDLPKIAESIKTKNPHDRKYILAAGRLAEQKNIEQLITAYSQSNLSTENIDLLIIGKGPAFHQLNEQVKSLNLANCVYFLGFQENPYQFMKHSEAFILSSKWEGFAHVVAEALACRTRVISSDCDFGPSEILANGKLGDLYPSEDTDALVDLLNTVNHPTTRVSNDKRLQEFDASLITSQYIQLFTKVANEA